MEIAELILKFIEALSLPIIGLIIFFALRQEIKALMTGRLSAKYKDLEFTIERQDNTIQAMEENVRDASEILTTELEKLKTEEQWSGFEYKASRLISAARSIGVNSDQHLIINILRAHGGQCTIADLVTEFIQPNSEMEAHEFRAAKQRLDFAVDALKQKGIVSASSKDRLKLHPWTPEIQSSTGEKAT